MNGVSGEVPESILTVGEVDHVGIAVADLEASCQRYVQLLGARPRHREIVAGQGVEVWFLELEGTTRLELIAPVDPDGPVARFLQRRGEGLHHVCLRVPDLERALAELQAHGVRCVDERPRRGAAGSRIAFLHPMALGGVLLELKEAAADTGS